MGRIAKKTIDRIIAMRLEGYLQREVAEELDIDPKTVGNYDPLRSVVAALPPIEERVARLEDWVRMITMWVPAHVSEVCVSLAIQLHRGEKQITMPGGDGFPEGRLCLWCFFQPLSDQQSVDDIAQLDETGYCVRCRRRFLPPLNPWERSPDRPGR